MNKYQLLRKVDKAWQNFTASYQGLTQPRLLAPGVTGNWSVRDIIAHVTWWEEEALKSLSVILNGQRPTRYSVKYGGIDAFNAIMTDQKKNLSLAEVIDEQHETHGRLIQYIQNAPEDQFTTETRFCRRIRLDTYGHYPIHAKAIRQWRDRKGITGAGQGKLFVNV